MDDESLLTVQQVAEWLNVENCATPTSWPGPAVSCAFTSAGTSGFLLRRFVLTSRQTPSSP